jgi:hypothetical protein
LYTNAINSKQYTTTSIMAAEKTNWADAADEADKLASEVDSKASLEEEGPCSSCYYIA